MFSEEEKQRYSRHLILEGFGWEAQTKLKNARVLMAGAGGLGCPALFYLTAAGVGHISIIDDDTVALSNLQRQVLFTIDDIGKPKAIAACERLSRLNNQIELHPYPERITVDNAPDLIKDHDLVIDGTDNFATRYLLNDACVLLHKPLVYGAIFKFSGQVSVFNWNNGPTYRCLFPEPPQAGEMPSCGEIGVLGVLPGIIGAWQATEAIKIITGIGQPLSGKLLTFDLLSTQEESFEYTDIESNILIDKMGNYDETCAPAFNEVDSQTVKQWLAEEKVQLIDVRETNEYEAFHIGGKNIPLSVLEKRIQEIDPEQITVIHCQSGIRSKKAIDLIQNHFPGIRIYNLKGGISGF
jgi:adenylyltransferase/sulfurtransferase